MYISFFFPKSPSNLSNSLYLQAFRSHFLSSFLCTIRYTPLSTALDAGRLAEALGVKHLVLYHTEDKTLAERKEAYTREASSVFTGRVYVPDDLERISLE